MADKLMNFPNDDTQNPLTYKCVFKTFGHTSMSTNQSKFKSPKFLNQQVKKRIMEISRNIGI